MVDGAHFQGTLISQFQSGTAGLGKACLKVERLRRPGCTTLTMFRNSSECRPLQTVSCGGGHVPFSVRQKNVWMQLCQELAEIQSARDASIISWVLEHPGLRLVMTSGCQLWSLEERRHPLVPGLRHTEFYVGFKDRKIFLSHCVFLLAMCIVPSPWELQGRLCTRDFVTQDQTGAPLSFYL